jgi:hypothetical protein|tara:strand:+ start:378 stop:629 length:252 start_codon:yes stop_codon:yes gene_type:complete
LQEHVENATKIEQDGMNFKMPSLINVKPLKKSKRSAESKKLVFLSAKVLEEVKIHRETTGTKIAQRILEIYRERKMNMDFKNV